MGSLVLASNMFNHTLSNHAPILWIMVYYSSLLTHLRGMIVGLGLYVGIEDGGFKLGPVPTVRLKGESL